MVRLGAHMSIAGGYYRAVEAAAEAGCDCVQLFVKNNNQWRAKPITDQDIRRFQESLERTGVACPLAHASYLINLASPDRALWNKSIDALVVELERARCLGIGAVVVHPGAHMAATRRTGLRRVAQALDRVHRRFPDETVRVLLENTAGQGTTLGADFGELAEIADLCRSSERLGFCLDTCHAFAAGYGWTGAAAFRKTLGAIEATVGLGRIEAIHVNDSRREQGSRVDRHAHIGQGQIGLEGFHRLLRSRSFRSIPMYLETPKGTHPETGRSWDEENLAVLRRLASRPLGRGARG